jgi:hypothetical protein
MVMKTNFLCPKCRGYLNVGDRVIFAIKKEGWSGGLLLLSPELGEYSFIHHPSFTINEGEFLEFYCPICNHDLSLNGSVNLAKVVMNVGDSDEFNVVFSKKHGERCTYKISGGKVSETYGEHSVKHLDLLSDLFLK